ncbi:hypothetical protein VDGL01_12421 [Verticillium dahliae]
MIYREIVKPRFTPSSNTTTVHGSLLASRIRHHLRLRRTRSFEPTRFLRYLYPACSLPRRSFTTTSMMWKDTCC